MATTVMVKPTENSWPDSTVMRDGVQADEKMPVINCPMSHWEEALSRAGRHPTLFNLLIRYLKGCVVNTLVRFMNDLKLKGEHTEAYRWRA